MDGSAFKLAFTISDISRLVFGLLDPTSRALAACVCKAWRAALPLSGGAKRRLVAHVMAERPELMNWALGPEPKIISTPRLYEIVVAQGVLESAQCLAARLPGFDKRALLRAAAESGHLPILKWVHGALGMTDDMFIDDCCWFAATRCRLDVLKWIAETAGADRFHRSKMRAQCCYGAADGGHLEALMWAAGDAWPSTGTASGSRERCRALARMARQSHIDEWITGPASPHIEEAE